MVALEFVVEDESLRNTFKTIPRHVHNALKRSFDRDGADWDSAMQWRTSSGSVRRRTGSLARSLGYAVTGSYLDELELSAFASGDNPAKIRALEFGAVVTPKRSRYLTIPIGANLRAGSGTVRHKSARRLFAQFPKEVFVLRAKSGKKFIVRRKGKGKNARLDFLFKLQLQSIVPGPRAPHPAPRPGGSYLGFFHEWKIRQKSRESRHIGAIGDALTAAVSDAVGEFEEDF